MAVILCKPDTCICLIFKCWVGIWPFSGDQQISFTQEKDLAKKNLCISMLLTSMSGVELSLQAKMNTLRCHIHIYFYYIFLYFINIYQFWGNWCPIKFVFQHIETDSSFISLPREACGLCVIFIYRNTSVN